MSEIIDAVERRFPICDGRVNGLKKTIPWSVAEKAYKIYAANYGGGSQSLERVAERGGFYEGEMDTFYPAWREETEELHLLRAEVKKLRQHSAIRESMPTVGTCPTCGKQENQICSNAFHMVPTVGGGDSDEEQIEMCIVDRIGRFQMKHGSHVVAKEIIRSIRPFLRTPAPLPIRGEGWMPIASAPKDGSHVLLTNGNIVGMGGWHDGGGKEPFDKWTGNPSYGSHLPRCDYWGQAYGYGNAIPFSKDQPTHWMPLPAPPGTIETSQLPVAQEAAVKIEAVTDYARKLEGALRTFDEAMRNGSMGPEAEKHKQRALTAAHRKAVRVLSALNQETGGVNAS